MIKAIKILEGRIKSLNEEIIRNELIMDEPEMLSDYEFSLNNITNCNLEIIELQQAIKVLSDNPIY